MQKSFCFVMLACLGPGCTSPPSVVPLLSVVDRVLAEELAGIEVDRRRDKASVASSLKAMRDAYSLDLSQAESQGRLSADWVLDANAGYVLAREELVRYEAALAAERDTRQENIEAALTAQRRAVWLLESQDQALVDALGVDRWDLSDALPKHGDLNTSLGRQ